MPKFTFHLGVTLRCYGNVEVEAETVEAALPLLTADFVGENIDITETTTDSGQDLAIIDVSSDGGAEGLEEWDGHSLPSPYDPPEKTPAEIAAPAMLAALKRAADWIDRISTSAACHAARDGDNLGELRAIIAAAEGRAHD